MGKRKRGGGKPSRQGPAAATSRASAKPVNPRDRLLDNLLLVLCGAGALLPPYLTYVAWFGDHPLYCSEGSDCDLVQRSRWSRFTTSLFVATEPSTEQPKVRRG